MEIGKAGNRKSSRKSEVGNCRALWNVHALKKRPSGSISASLCNERGPGWLLPRISSGVAEDLARPGSEVPTCQLRGRPEGQAPPTSRVVSWSWRHPSRRAIPVTPVRLAASQLAGDDQSLDFRGALADLHEFGVPQVPLYGILFDVTVAAMNLNGLQSGPHRGLGGH